jgi:small subunit ribosomal protein S16
MVRIRLLRVGAIRQPSYRIVVADQRSPRDGRFIEIIGHYNPRTEPETVAVDRERALHWLQNGAQPSEAVARLLEKTSVMAIHRGETTLEAVQEASLEVEAAGSDLAAKE